MTTARTVSLARAAARAAVRHPLSLTVAVGVLGVGVASSGLADGLAPEDVIGRVLSWAALIAVLAVAERQGGSVRAALAASVGTAVAVVLSWGVLSALAGVGESLSDDALHYPAWTPSVTTVLLVVTVSGALRPATRRRIRWVAATFVVAMLLVNGHASDLSRVVAFGLALAAAPWWSPSSAHAAAPWPAATRSTWRRLMASAVVVVASALVTLAPDASGVLARTGAAVDPAVAPLTAALLVVSVLLIAIGRVTGVVVAGGVLLFVAVTVFAEIVDLAADGTILAPGLGDPRGEWRIVLVLAGILPALAALIVVLGVRAVIRRSAPVPTVEERSAVRDTLVRDGSGAFAHMATWAGNSIWIGSDGAVVAYRVRHGVAITVGDPICTDRAATVRSFAAFCEERGWTPVFYSVHDETAGALDAVGWSRMPVGTEAVLATAGFSVAGKRRQDLRTAVNRAAREGVEAVWTRYVDLDEPTRAQVEEICAVWAHGRALPEMGFTLGGLDELRDRDVRLMLARAADGRVHAVTSWLPRRCDGVVVGWTLDVMRRAEYAMPGAMEFAIVSTVRRAEADGVPTVSLSGTPLAPHEGATRGRLSRRVVRALEPAYGFSSLERFKSKFGAAHEPLWMCFPETVQLGRIAPALVKTYVPELRLRGVIATLKAMA
ncbi:MULTISPECIES: bifunctional lysylphosphatidylglycerol flippase/synthetase MprF [Microbacterium]|uniref:bifunctional lysylphosphatidylglycerol flippase/synthetase MprF n=1 Tax=Microbacterium TaxID=33882 RepID=UPI001CC28A91|nr:MULTISPECIES: DUF2156 domain-containing protein [Microbacterium]